MKESKIIRCALYDRVSTDLQVKEGLSLDAQRQALTDYAIAHGYKIVGYYNDEGITARKKMQNRKDLIRLLNDVKADKIDLILVTKLDRWFRNVKDYHNTQAILEAHNCNWKTIFEEYDTSTSNGRFAINIMLSVNENECDRDSERIKTVFEYKKRRKEHLNGRPAYGYIADAEKHLVKDPETHSIVEDAFEHYFSTYSKKATVTYILQKYAGHPHAPTMYQVNRMLQSETYAGRKYGIDGYCEPYITMEQFQTIQKISDAKIIPHQTEPFLFSSMIRCPICGKNMTGFVKREKLKSGRISEYKRYRCGQKFTEYHNGACISETVIEAYLISHVTDQLEQELLQVKAASKKRPAPAANPDSVQKEIDRLNTMYQKGRISDAYYDEQYFALKEKLSRLLESSPKVASLDSYKPLIQTFSNGWQEMYHKLDIVHKKAFWKGIIKEIYVDPKSRKICGFKFIV